MDLSLGGICTFIFSLKMPFQREVLARGLVQTSVAPTVINNSKTQDT